MTSCLYFSTPNPFSKSVNFQKKKTRKKKKKKKKECVAHGEQIFPLRVDPLSEGGENNFERVYEFPLKRWNADGK